ncbi:MAG: CHASE2 domain-containing protein [Pseudomonadaceae bacterium]|nr:CHASE2 domain-containing protein [Pseudomonadaceae bacterium]
MGLFLMLYVGIFNPFGIRDAADKSTENWLLRMHAPFYPEQGQEEVVVVLIDDQALSDMRTSWPMRYAEQARLLRQLLGYQPKSLFIDLLYTQRRFDGGSTESLRRVLLSAREQGTPLILADYRDAAGRSQLLPELRAAAQTAQVNWSGYGERYPLVLDATQGDPRTPALQLYQTACVAPDCPSAPFAEPLLVRWGYWSDPAMAPYVDTRGCGMRGERGNWAQLASLLFRDGLRAQQDVDSVERPQPCPYTRTLYANQLRDPRVGEVLKGRHVLLGVSVRGIPDWVDSPVQGRLPGVYWHAMALDNLLTQGETYWRDAPAGPAGVAISDWLEMVLVLLAGIVALCIVERPAGQPTGNWRYLLWFLLLAGLAIGFSWALARWWHIAPLDWLGLVLAIGVFYAYLGEPRLADWWADTINAWRSKEKRDA